MSNFSALKTAIQNAIKQNGNEEITGNLLQGILLSIVETLGDSAINTLETGLSNEATTRGDADTQLNNLITGVKNNVDNGYVYAGIATPSTTPVSGKVFYIALQAGTYTNLGGTTVTEGITILKYNGTSWVKEQVLFTDGGVFDISAYHATGDTLSKYSDLTAALGTSGANIPQSIRNGGMSVKFVQSSDNNYTQYIYLGTEVTGTPNPFLDTANWQRINSNEYGFYTCSDGASTPTKVLNGNKLPSITHGIQIAVRFSSSNNVDNVTLTIGQVTKPLYYNGLPASSTNHWNGGEYVIVCGTSQGAAFYAFSLEWYTKLNEYKSITRLSSEDKILGFAGSFAELQVSATVDTNLGYYIAKVSDADFKKIAYYINSAWVLSNYKIDSPELQNSYLTEDNSPLQPFCSSQAITESLRRFGGYININAIKNAQWSITTEGVWDSPNNKHIAIYVSGVAKVRLVGSSLRNTYYSFLKEYNRPYGSGIPQFCTGTDNRYTLTKDATVEVTIPSDCKWLVISSKLVAGDSMPQSIYIVGTESPAGINDNAISQDSTWSSSKISSEINSAGVGGNQLSQDIRTALLPVVKYNKNKDFANIAYFTDSHANAYDASKSIDMIRRIAISKITDMNIHGGDTITTDDASGYTIDNLINDTLMYLNQFKIIDDLVFLKGNHDSGHQEESGVDNGNLSNMQYRMLYQQGKAYNDCIFGSESGATYFYKDITEKKIRVIALDAFHDWSSADNSEKMSFGSDQESWFYNTALDFTGKTGWSVVVFTHYFGFSASVMEANPLSVNMTNILKAFQDKGTAYGGYQFDANLDTLLVGVIMGHAHTDLYNNSQGFNTIRVTCAYEIDNEGAVDVFTIDTTNNILYQTRIGRGSSHSYAFGNNPHEIVS